MQRGIYQNRQTVDATEYTRSDIVAEKDAMIKELVGAVEELQESLSEDRLGQKVTTGNTTLQKAKEHMK